MNDSGFLFIPEHIMEREDISLQEKCVYGRVLGLTKKEGYCYITNELLGGKIGLSGGRVSKYISSLVDKGLLRVEVKKTKKKEGAPKEWGTRRKIYAYVNEATSPLVENDQPPLVENDQYSITDNSIRGGVTSLPPIDELLGNKEKLTRIAKSHNVFVYALEKAVRKYYFYCEEKKAIPTAPGLNGWLLHEKWEEEDKLNSFIK